jgi:hypothetical protein
VWEFAQRTAVFHFLFCVFFFCSRFFNAPHRVGPAAPGAGEKPRDAPVELGAPAPQRADVGRAPLRIPVRGVQKKPKKPKNQKN